MFDELKAFTKRGIGLVLPSAALVVAILGLYIVGFNILHKRITTQLTEISDLKRETGTLETKLNLLRNIDPSILDKADDTLYALPSYDPTTLSLSQLRTVATESGTLIGKQSAERFVAAGDLSSRLITFSIQGDIADIFKFLQILKTKAPVSSVPEIRIENSIGSDSLAGDVQVIVYWGDLPTRIPLVNEPIKTLTDEEVKVLNQIKDLQKPEFSNLAAEKYTDRPDPFK